MGAEPSDADEPRATPIRPAFVTYGFRGDPNRVSFSSKTPRFKGVREEIGLCRNGIFDAPLPARGSRFVSPLTNHPNHQIRRAAHPPKQRGPHGLP